MPAINSIYIKVYDQKPVYRPGDELKGEWTVDTGEAFGVKKVSVSFHGAALTRWDNTEPKADDNKGYEEITSQEKVVFPLTNKSGDTVDYPAGKYVYKFNFKIPSGMLPSTYEGKYGAIRYWLSFDIERPVLRSHIRRIKVLTVLDDINVNLTTYSKFVGRKTEKVVAKALGFGNQGTVTLFAQTDRGAYCPGEKIYIKYIAENKSDKDLGRIRTELTQKVRFRASGEEKFKYLCVKYANGDELKKGGKLSSTDNKHCITIPAVPPSTMERTSHVIKVQYYVKVIIDIPKVNGGDAMVILPITVGSIPQGHKAVQEPQGASNIHVIDASSAITYTQCVDGYEDGPKIWEDKKFPRFTYVPWCTYVPDFKPPGIKNNVVRSQNITKPVNSGKSNISSGAKQTLKVEKAVIKPAVGNQIRVQPSAPPMSDNPPTYDEAMREMQLFPLQKPDENTGSQERLAEKNESKTENDQEKSAEQSDYHCVIMIIRFSDTCLKQFRTALKQNGAKLIENGGKIIAIAPQVFVTKGSWPVQTSIAILSFETFDVGSEWFKSFKESNDTSDIDVLDCHMLKGTDEEFENEKNVFSLSFLRRQVDKTSEEFKSVTKRVREVIKPIRFELGGRSICSGEVGQNLTEQTLSPGSIITVVQWDSLRQKEEYVNVLKEKYKDILVSLSKLYKTEVQTIFQTENTSYMIEETD